MTTRAPLRDRLVRGALGVSLMLGVAPFQCGSRGETVTRREESAGDALWKLAQDFRARGEEKAADETLRFLATQYPSSRFAPAARDELEAKGVRLEPASRPGAGPGGAARSEAVDGGA